MIVHPHMVAKGRCMCNMKGMGMGSVLLNGSAGVAGTYTSAAPSPGNLGVSTQSGGALSKSIAAKLDKLRVTQKRKPENIKFSI
jgi:hypothetical protein